MTHCSDDELQLFATGQELPEKARTHIETCPSCQEQIAAYKLILSGIDQQTADAFDFDLADAVLQQLQPVKAKQKLRSFWPAIIAAFTAGSLYLFRNNFEHLVAGISVAFLLISIVICMGIISFKIFKMYESYHRQIDKLNQ